jgi:hypothetical protein
LDWSLIVTGIAALVGVGVGVVVAGYFGRARLDELKMQLETLRQLNQQIGEDARNLTNGLKGEAKTQGTWGEMILERTLELSGLVKGREYDVQMSSAGEEGNRRGRQQLVVARPAKVHALAGHAAMPAQRRDFPASERLCVSLHRKLWIITASYNAYR